MILRFMSIQEQEEDMVGTIQCKWSRSFKMGRSLEKRERDNAERCDKCGYSHSINKNHTLDDTW